MDHEIGAGALALAFHRCRNAVFAARQQERGGNSQQVEENEAAAQRRYEHGKSNAEPAEWLPTV